MIDVDAEKREKQHEKQKRRNLQTFAVILYDKILQNLLFLTISQIRRVKFTNARRKMNKVESEWGRTKNERNEIHRDLQRLDNLSSTVYNTINHFDYDE